MNLARGAGDSGSELVVLQSHLLSPLPRAHGSQLICDLGFRFAPPQPGSPAEHPGRGGSLYAVACSARLNAVGVLHNAEGVRKFQPRATPWEKSRLRFQNSERVREHKPPLLLRSFT